MKPLLATLVLACLPRPAAGDATLKIATLAPEGSSWMKLAREWQRAVEARTAGRVRIKFYPGGLQGDERDMLRKMRLGQLGGAQLTAIGLAALEPETSGLGVARTAEDLDEARAVLGDRLRARLEDKGYVLLGWGDVGPIHLFSNRPVRSLDDLAALRLWMWSDDPLTRKLFDALGLHGVALGIPEVLPALSTGQIDAFFASPLAALALQWASHARYATAAVMGQATGATVIARAAWEAVAPEDRRAILEESHALERRVIAEVRADNARALDSLKSRGLEIVATPPALERELTERGLKVADEAGAAFTPEYRALVQQLVERLRARRTRSPGAGGRSGHPARSRRSQPCLRGGCGIPGRIALSPQRYDPDVQGIQMIRIATELHL